MPTFNADQKAFLEDLAAAGAAAKSVFGDATTPDVIFLAYDKIPPKSEDAEYHKEGLEALKQAFEMAKAVFGDKATPDAAFEIFERFYEDDEDGDDGVDDEE
jgi:hypothetical protein